MSLTRAGFLATFGAAMLGATAYSTTSIVPVASIAAPGARRHAASKAVVATTPEIRSRTAVRIMRV